VGSPKVTWGSWCESSSGVGPRGTLRASGGKTDGETREYHLKGERRVVFNGGAGYSCGRKKGHWERSAFEVGRKLGLSI